MFANRSLYHPTQQNVTEPGDSAEASLLNLLPLHSNLTCTSHPTHPILTMNTENIPCHTGPSVRFKVICISARDNICRRGRLRCRSTHSPPAAPAAWPRRRTRRRRRLPHSNSPDPLDSPHTTRRSESLDPRSGGPPPRTDSRPSLVHDTVFSTGLTLMCVRSMMLI